MVWPDSCPFLKNNMAGKSIMPYIAATVLSSSTSIVKKLACSSYSVASCLNTGLIISQVPFHSVLKSIAVARVFSSTIFLKFFAVSSLFIVVVLIAYKANQQAKNDNVVDDNR